MPLHGGLSDSAFEVASAGERFVVRCAGEAGVHPLDRRAEIAATRAAALCGIGPAIVWADPAILVRRFVDGRTLGAEDWGDGSIRRRAAALIRRVPRELAPIYRGPHIDRSPGATLGHYRHLLRSRANPWQAQAAAKEALIRRATGPLAELPTAIGHNDIHGANIVDDGSRLWLIDWEYAGAAPPVCDLASLLVNARAAGGDAAAMAAFWSGSEPLDPELLAAARLAAALRDLFWGYAQALAGGFDGRDDYLAENERRVQAEADALRALG
jgi:thiamine kinase-like enzyme